MLPFTTYQIPETPNNKTANFEHWLWVICQNPLTTAESELLDKITSALHASLDQHVFMITLAANTYTLSEVDGTKPKLVISFGIAPEKLGLWIDQEKPGLTRLESYYFIRTKSLDALAGSAAAKKELWAAMQEYLEHQ